MFTFNFSNNEVEGGYAEDEESQAYSGVTEVTIETIKKLSPSCEEGTASFTFGSLSIKTIPTKEAVDRALSRGYGPIIKAEESHSDLISGQYEGGFKIWECTKDLVEFLGKSDVDWRNKMVLDLGCGAGILGLIALVKGAKVIFQDYNHEVLELLTGQNVLLNFSNITLHQVRFYSGDWLAFLDYFVNSMPGKLFDVILTSETIYNSKNYYKLHDVIKNLLAPTGVCYLAGKSIYFGVGGSMRGFHDFVDAKGLLQVRTSWSTPDGVVREIFEITHKTEKENNLPNNCLKAT